ncbi:glucose-6-phosphate isomerase, partial [Patescibacteria group bacterium]|nr:glucose-6-phosphate isomerase [Patescibacteria group bacterium]
KFNQKIKVPNSIKNIPSLNYALKHDFSDLIHSAAQGTAIALKDKNKPVGIINIKNINENSLGELIMFLQIATAVAGNLYCINPFNQPGVEDSKNRVKELLTNN